MKNMKIIVILFCIVLFITSIFLIHNYQSEIENKKLKEDLNQEVWYPESLEGCQKQRAILLDSIKQLEIENGC